MNKNQKNTFGFLKENGMIAAILFAVVCLVLIWIGIFALKEFVVSVCILVILETGMATVFHKVELWKHALLLAVQIAAGFIIGRVLLVLICVIAYVAATIALQFMSKE